MKWLPIACSAFLALAVSACAAGKPPTDQLAQTHTAIGAAQALDGRSPRASLHLTMAREQLARAEQLIRQGKYEQADRVLQRAEADAELAGTLARQATLEVRARNSRRELDELRREVR
jgi:hypothetical protein